MSDANDTPVVTVFLRNRGEVLLFRRSDAVDSYPGQWGAVAGHVENDHPRASALHEIEEETGLGEDEVVEVQASSSFPVEDDERGTRWIVHPFLFDTDTRSIETNWETAEVEWASPTTLLRRDTVPDLWTSYRRVAPSIVGLSNDTAHGSAYLSIRALEVLRDRAGMLAASDAQTIGDARSRLVATAPRLLDTRPSMAAVTNRIHRVMHASHPDLEPDTVEREAHRAIREALAADEAAAEQAAGHAVGEHVLTLSRSGTVLDALVQANPEPRVSVAVSEPGGEGIPVAEFLAHHGLDVTLIPDAAVARRLQDRDIESVLVGADTVLPSGGVSNKVGTLGAALAAQWADVPFYAACSIDKISVIDNTTNESVSPREVYDGAADIDTWAPRFDTASSELVTGGVVTERGILSPNDVQTVAAELRELRSWT